MDRVSFGRLRVFCSTTMGVFAFVKEFKDIIWRGEIMRIVIEDNRFSLGGVIAGISYHTDFPIVVLRFYFCFIISSGAILALALFGKELMLGFLIGVIFLYRASMQQMPLAKEVPTDYNDRVTAFIS